VNVSRPSMATCEDDGTGELVELSLTVNDEPVTAVVEARRLLADFVRHDLALTGTHVGCEQGVCGMCTVLLNGEPVKSCTMLAVQAADHDVRTVEWLGSEAELHPVQAAFRDEHGLQCGYCTPGFMLTAYALAQRGVELDEPALREELSGNICRCTGYQNIVAAVRRYLSEPNR